MSKPHIYVNTTDNLPIWIIEKNGLHGQKQTHTVLIFHNSSEFGSWPLFFIPLEEPTSVYIELIEVTKNDIIATDILKPLHINQI